MAQRTQWLFNFLALALIAGAFGGAVYIFALAIKHGATVLAAFVAAFATVGGALIVRFYDRRKATEAARREHLGPLYERMAGVLAGQTLTPRALTKVIPDFQRKALLYAGPQVLTAFHEWLVRLPDDDGRRGPDEMTGAERAEARASMLRYESFVKAMRKDVGVSNWGTEQGDLLRAVLTDFDAYFGERPEPDPIRPPESDSEAPRISAGSVVH